MTVDVDTIVSEAISRHKVAAGNADIEVARRAQLNLRVLGDQTLLTLANLVSNAIAYSPRGRWCRSAVAVAVPTSNRRHRPGHRHRAEDQERVFERFFRGQGALACHRRQRTRVGHRQTRRG